MALIDNCILWSKLGTNGQINSPEIGTGSTVGTISYAPGRFDNGVDNANNINYGTFTWTNRNKGIIEFWWKPNFPSTSTVQSVQVQSNPLGEHFRAMWKDVKNYRIYFNEFGYFAEYFFDMTFSANDLFHMLIMFDSAESNNNRIKLYKDGVLQNLAFTNNDGPWNFSDGTMEVGSDVQTTGGVVDNVKVYDDTTSILAEVIANRNNEGFPTGGTKKLLDGFDSNLTESVLI